jgi:hypothetical protein
MFPGLSPLVANDTDLEALATAMRDLNPADPTLDNPTVPAGFAYLGQFVDHDISLDLSPLSAKVEDPTMLQNFRTPGLDLDCCMAPGLVPTGSSIARTGPGPSSAPRPRHPTRKTPPSLRCPTTWSARVTAWR